MRSLQLFALQWLTVSHLLGVPCPSLSWDELHKKFSGKSITIVFFASWCAACEVHLTKSPSKDTLFLATFDERERAAKVAQAFHFNDRCYSDTDIAKFLGVRTVPAVREIRIP